jgi:hypothetical protein
VNDGLWTSDSAFLVDLTGHFNSPNKDLQGKQKLITEMFDNIREFEVKFRPRENQRYVTLFTF